MSFQTELKMNKKIAIIGGGNLGSAIAEGLIISGFSLPEHIIISKRNIKTLAEIEAKGVLVTPDNNEALSYADLVIVAVKPYQIKDVLISLREKLDAQRHILISVVTGVP
ncbi:MAG: pyrroline-5-carboxylate reductase family protein, partial [bacterium]